MLLDRLFHDLELTTEAFAVCEVSPGWRLRLGRNGWVTVHFVVSGQGRLRMPDGQVVVLAPRSLVMVPADRAHVIETGDHVEHEVAATDASPREGNLFVYGAGPESADELDVVCGRIKARYGSGLGLFDHLENPLSVDFSDSTEMASLFDRLLSEQRQRSAMSEAMSEAMMTSLMTEAMVLMFRRLCTDPECPLPWLTALEDSRLSAALAQVLEHPERAHSVGFLADASLMSRTGFSEAFTERFGRPPMTYLRETRMRRAASLLQGTDMTVDQVASKVGYSSRSQFSRAFSSFFGSPPAAFRSGRPEWPNTSAER